MLAAIIFPVIGLTIQAQQIHKYPVLSVSLQEKYFRGGSPLETFRYKIVETVLIKHIDENRKNLKVNESINKYQYTHALSTSVSCT